MSDPLTLLRECNMEKKLDYVKLEDGHIVIG
jgi:hypothetical protein